MLDLNNRSKTLLKKNKKFSGKYNYFWGNKARKDPVFSLGRRSRRRINSEIAEKAEKKRSFIQLQTDSCLMNGEVV